MTPQQITDATDTELREKIGKLTKVVDAYDRWPKPCREQIAVAADKLRAECEDELERRAELKGTDGTDVQSVSNV
jgi:hypothetical protein